VSTPSHHNSFNLLRLVFAGLVIVSHGPELIDGDRHRELLTLLFGTYSFGEFAVNSFFILSGFLITGSWLATQNLGSYLRKRVLRILPGFLVAVTVSIVLFGPIGSPAFWSEFSVSHFLVRLPLLVFDSEGFPGSVAPQLNGALWTIHYEFVCYLLVAVMGLLGMLKRPKLVGILFVVVLAFYIFHLAIDPLVQTRIDGAVRSLWNRLGHYVRFFAMFMSGAVLYFVRDRIKANALTIGAALVAFVALMFNRYTAPIAMAVPYVVLLYLAGRRENWASRKMGTTDLSYGVYLYAWPVEQVIIQRITDDVWAVVALTLLGATLFAVVSWHLIEKPALRYKSVKRAAAIEQRQMAT
jgi:peptidoglycan/LPS O-acetylase OafA/YrhL